MGADEALTRSRLVAPAPNKVENDTNCSRFWFEGTLSKLATVSNVRSIGA